MLRSVLRSVPAVTALAAVLLGAGPASMAEATDVHGDDAGDRYVGTGGLILPGTFPESTRQAVARCQDCRWRMTTPCVLSSGNAFDGQPACTSVVRGCPGGELLRTWSSVGGGPWRAVGLACIGPEGPVTVARIATGVADRAVHELPPLAPRAQPRRGVLVQVPVLFRADQTGRAAWTGAVLGHRVRIDATATWSWEFGDGTRLVTSDAGGAFPEGGVRHTYRTAGPFPVACTARWRAVFTVDGLGPFDVEEPVDQGGSIVVVVGEGRAVLSGAAMAQ